MGIMRQINHEEHCFRAYMIPFMVSLKNEKQTIDVAIVDAKNYTVDQPVKILHYSEPDALELLTYLYQRDRFNPVTLFNQQYEIVSVVPEAYSFSPPEDLIPSDVIIKSGGGYSHYIKNKRCEIVDLLLYSPFKDRYRR